MTLRSIGATSTVAACIAGFQLASAQGLGGQAGGQWSDVITLPLEAISLTLLPTGKIMMWGRTYVGDVPTLWDMNAGTFTAVNSLGTDVFCAGQTLATDGTLLVAGGHLEDFWGITDTVRFDPFSESWTRCQNMQYPRWYPTLVTMTDGRIFCDGGSMSIDAYGNTLYPPNAEIYDINQAAWAELPNAAYNVNLYRCLYQLPNGLIGFAGKSTPFGTLDPATWSWTINNTWSGNGYVGFAGGGGTMVTPGKAIKVGGPSHSDSNASVNYASMIDFSQSNPMWHDIPSMTYPRFDMTTTMLPDGTVLVCGGSTQFSVASTCIKTPELYDPVANAWSKMNPHAIGRSYHGSAILLPDGRVLLAGSGIGNRAAPNNPDQLNAEIFSPPYLFKGTRPNITAAPNLVLNASQFNISTDQANSISKVSMIRLGSMTHTFDEATRFVPCDFTNNGDGTLNITAPTTAVGTPGYYMLFVVNSQGVPSVAKIFLMSEQVTTIPCSNVNVVSGYCQKNDASLVGAKDGNFLKIVPIPGTDGLEHAQAIFTMPVNRSLASSMTVDFDSFWPNWPGTQTIEIYDFSQGAWVTLSSGAAPGALTDTQTIKTMGVERFIDPNTSSVQIRSTWVGLAVTGIISLPICIDDVDLTLTR